MDKIDKYLKIIDILRATSLMTPEKLKEIESYGMISKKDLVDMHYYKGKCRNAFIAKWDARKGIFIHLRTKFGSTFVEEIYHPEDDNGFDVFVPFEEIENFKYYG